MLLVIGNGSSSCLMDYLTFYLTFQNE